MSPPPRHSCPKRPAAERRRPVGGRSGHEASRDRCRSGDLASRAGTSGESEQLKRRCRRGAPASMLGVQLLWTIRSPERGFHRPRRPPPAGATTSTGSRRHQAGRSPNSPPPRTTRAGCVRTGPPPAGGRLHDPQVHYLDPYTEAGLTSCRHVAGTTPLAPHTTALPPRSRLGCRSALGQGAQSPESGTAASRSPKEMVFAPV